MSLLFPEIDVVATCRTVDKFFKHDLDKLILMSGHSLTDLKSPVLSAVPGHSGKSGAAESAIIRGLNAEAEVHAIHNTMASLDQISQTILFGQYIEHASWHSLQYKLHVEKTQFSKLRQHALLCFADSFDYWQRRLKCEPIIDLHEYKYVNDSRTNRELCSDTNELL